MSASKIIRISDANNKCEHDILAELEFVNYLANNGAYVSRAIYSKNKKLLEKIVIEGQNYFFSVFYKTKGEAIRENQAKQLPEEQLSTYFYQCGKTLGKLHNLSKAFLPTYNRHSFFDVYNSSYIEKLLPPDKTLLKEAMLTLLKELGQVEINKTNYGMIHFDINAFSFYVDMTSMHVAVFDFSHCSNSWYMYDLASVWTYIIHLVDACHCNSETERRAQIRQYFNTVLEGYRTESAISSDELTQLPRFVAMHAMVNVLRSFENIHSTTSDELMDSETKQLIARLENNEDFNYFFSNLNYNQIPSMINETEYTV